MVSRRKRMTTTTRRRRRRRRRPRRTPDRPLRRRIAHYGAGSPTE
jgi:hypothetical protein